MKRKLKRAFLAATLIFGSATAADAAEVMFNGAMSGTATSISDPSCTPLLFQSTLTGSGSSSLGSFSYTHHVCLSGPGPLHGIDFLLDFSGGNTLYGNMNGAATASGVPLVSNISLTYDILGGTGQFLNASGMFVGTGTVDQRTAGINQVAFSFAAVPEPGTWAMMLIGFAGIGISLRRRKAAALRPA